MPDPQPTRADYNQWTQDLVRSFGIDPDVTPVKSITIQINWQTTDVTIRLESFTEPILAEALFPLVAHLNEITLAEGQRFVLLAKRPRKETA